MRIWMLFHPLTTDILVFTVLTILHWGTFSGVMAATTGAAMCSAMLMLARWIWGAIKQGLYRRGLFDMSKQLGIPEYHYVPVSATEHSSPTTRQR